MGNIRQGYMFYPKDWNFSASVQKLNLEQEAVYRKLIDKIMTEGQGILYDSKYFKHYFKANANKVERIFKVLLEANLIEIENDIITVPSCDVRLARYEAGSKGGKARAKKVEDAKKTTDLLEAKTKPKESKVNININTNKKEEKQRFDFEYQSQNEKDFLNDWVEVRTEIKKGKTSKIYRLVGETKKNFQIIAADYSRDEIKLGLRGLFRQETFPNNQDLTTDPTHFLKDQGKYISKYIQATNEQNKNIWGTNK